MTFENNPLPFATVLDDWRRAHSWSDAELARQLRVPYLTVRDWLPRPAPRRSPKLESLIRRLMAEIDK